MNDLNQKGEFKLEKENVKNKQYIEPNIIHNYFKNIFQAEHLQSKPCTEDVKEELNVYAFHSERLDKEFSYGELTLAINNIGRGVGLDGLEKAIVHIFPFLTLFIKLNIQMNGDTKCCDQKLRKVILLPAQSYVELLYPLFYLKFMT